MFSIGNKLKVTLAAAESEYGQWKGSQVYDAMIKNAEVKRFEVVGMDTANYLIKRLEDEVVLPCDKQSAHSKFEVAND